MRKLFLAVFMVVFVAQGTALAAKSNRYAIASGIVEYEISGMQNGTETLYFDQNGYRQATYMQTTTSFMGFKQKTDTRHYIEGDYSYGYDEKTNTATKMNVKDFFEGAESKTPKEFSKKYLEAMGAKKTDTKTILGKKTQGWHIPDFGMTVYLYKDTLPLESSVDMMGMQFTRVATSFKENVSIPSDKISLPKSAKIQDAGDLGDVAEMRDQMKAVRQAQEESGVDLGGIMNMFKGAQEEAMEESSSEQSLREKELAIKEKELELKMRELELQKQQIQQQASQQETSSSASVSPMDAMDKTINTSEKVKDSLNRFKGLFGR